MNSETAYYGPHQPESFAPLMTEEPNIRSAYYQTLDAWRGLAALFVVLYHVVSELAMWYPTLGSQLGYRAMGFGFLGVQIFFVISGYCIAGAAVRVLEADTSSLSFLFARMHRIYPPMLWALLGAGIAKVGLTIFATRGPLSAISAGSSSLFHQSFIWYVTNLTLTQELFGTGYLLRIAWTLCYEAAFYVMVMLVLTVVRQRHGKKRHFLDALHALTLCVLLGLIAFPSRRFYPMDLWPEFGAGVLVFDLLTAPPAWDIRTRTLVLAIAGLVFVGTHDLPIGADHESSRLTYAVAGVTAIVLVLLHPLDARLISNVAVKGLATLGIFSYSIYLTHFPIITALFALMLRWRFPVLAQTIFLSVTAVTGGYIFYRLFERPSLTRKDKILVPTPVQRMKGANRKPSR